MRVSDHRTGASPLFEPLEPRLLLDGNVSVAEGASMKITGDAADNAIVITRTGDTLTVAPTDGTTSINGELPGVPVDFAAPTKGIKIDMGDGGDEVAVVAGQVHSGDGGAFRIGDGDGCLSIGMGGGEDTLDLIGVQVRDVKVDLGGGTSNSLFVSGGDPDGAGGASDIRTTIARNFSVKAGNSDNQVTLLGVFVGGSACFKLGEGTDFVVLDTYAGSDEDFGVDILKHVKLSSRGDGEDTLLIADSSDVGDIGVGGNVSAKLGSGVNTVNVAPAAELVVGGSLSIATSGTDGDAVTLADATVERNLSVKTGAGNDLVEILGAQIGGNTMVQTGDGADQLYFDAGTANTQTAIERKVKASMGAGDDTLSAANATAGSSSVDGGTGIDTLIVDDLTVAVLGKETDKGFEIEP